MTHLKSSYTHISAFDLDKTLLNCNSSYRFSRFLYKKKLFTLLDQIYSLQASIRYHFFNLPLEELHNRAFARLFKGKSLENLQELASIFTAQEIPSMINPNAIDRLNLAKNQNHYILLLSSAPHFLVKPIAKAIGIANWQATHYTTDKNGNFATISKIMNGQEKASQLKRAMIHLNIPRSQTIAYSDSQDDLLFLQEAGIAVAVNPTTKLRIICAQNNWEILEP